MLRATLRSFLAHKGRLLLSALTVVLSVAFVCGSLMFADTATATFDRLFASTAADVRIGPHQDFETTGGIGSGEVPTVPAALRERVASVEGVAAVHVDAAVRNVTIADENDKPVGPTQGAPSIALNWYRGESHPAEVTGGRPPRGPGEAMIDRDTADNEGVALGDRLRVLAPPGDFVVHIVGIATLTTTNPGAALLYLDTATAQRALLGKPDAATTISVDAAPGVSDAVLKQRLTTVLKGKYAIETRAEQRRTDLDRLGGFLSVIRYMMVGFGGVAVVVGIFLIVNTFSMLIAQRTRELGLLRALGAERRQVRRSVLVESLLLGVFGSAVGLGTGFGLAVLLITLMRAFGLRLDAADLVLRWPTPVAAFVVGVGVTLVAALLPSLRAGRVSPMAALADVEVADTGRPLRFRAVAALVAGAAGAAALVGAAFSDEGAAAGGLLGLGVVLTLITAVIAGPLLARPVIHALGLVLPGLRGPVGRMSRRNALRNPRRTGATASALMVGLALVTGLSVAGTSADESVDRQIDRTLGADFIVQSSTFVPFSRQITERIRATDGVGTVVRQRFVRLELLLPDGVTVRTTGGAVDPGLDEVVRMPYTAGDTAAAVAPGRLALDGRFAREHGLSVGDRLDARMASGRRVGFTVGALTDRGGSGPGAQGGVLMGLGTLERLAPGSLDSVVHVNAAGRADSAGSGDVERLRAALKRELKPFPQVQVRDGAEYKELIGGQIQILLNLLYGLLGLAIVIAVLGVVNTLALAVVERTREIGLLRAIGLSGRQLQRMIRSESVIIAVFGAVLGLGLGLAWGVVTQRVLALEGLTELAIPWTTVLVVVLGSVLIGLLAALLPALRAARLDILAAIAHE